MASSSSTGSRCLLTRRTASITSGSPDVEAAWLASIFCCSFYFIFEIKYSFCLLYYVFFKRKKGSSFGYEMYDVVRGKQRAASQKLTKNSGRKRTNCGVGLYIEVCLCFACYLYGLETRLATEYKSRRRLSSGRIFLGILETTRLSTQLTQQRAKERQNDQTENYSVDSSTKKK